MPATSRRGYLMRVGAGLSAVIAGCTRTSRSTSATTTGDWTQIGRDSRHSGSDTSRSGISRGAVHWRSTLGADLETAGVAVANDRLVAAGRRAYGRGFLRQVSLRDGETTKSVELSAPVVAPPVVSATSILLTCWTADRAGRLRAVSDEGDERWTRRIDGPRPAPPTVHRSTVYGGSKSGTVFALEESDGTIRWERSFGDERQGGTVSAPLTVDETGVYVPVSSSKARGIYALSPTDGSTRWKIEGPRIRSTMVRVDELLLVSYPWYTLSAFDIQTGERRWSKHLAERRVSPPAVGDGIIVVADEATLYGLESETGDERWSRAIDPDPHTQPVIAGDTVISRSAAGIAAHAVADGERLWTLDSGSGVPIVPVENGFVFAPSSGTLAAYTEYQA